MTHHHASISFDPSVLVADPSRRGQILSILEAALRAVDPGEALRRSLHRQGNELIANDTRYSLDRFRRIFVIGFGKAAAPMGQAAAEILGERLTAGLLVTKVGHGGTYSGLPQVLTLLEAAHPLPDAAGVAAAQRIADLTRQATADDLVICLISGGGSALLTLPAEGLTLADLQGPPLPCCDVAPSSTRSIHCANTCRRSQAANWPAWLRQPPCLAWYCPMWSAVRLT